MTLYSRPARPSSAADQDGTAVELRKPSRYHFHVWGQRGGDGMTEGPGKGDSYRSFSRTSEPDEDDIQSDSSDDDESSDEDDAPSTSSRQQSTATDPPRRSEEFHIGDAVYVHLVAKTPDLEDKNDDGDAPPDDVAAGVITDIIHGHADGIECKLRWLQWPSRLRRRRRGDLDGYFNENEVLYLDSEPSAAKTPMRVAACVGKVQAQDIIGAVEVHASQKDCVAALDVARRRRKPACYLWRPPPPQTPVKSAPRLSSGARTTRRARRPTRPAVVSLVQRAAEAKRVVRLSAHLYVERTCDPRSEALVPFDWEETRASGRETGTWDVDSRYYESEAADDEDTASAGRGVPSDRGRNRKGEQTAPGVDASAEQAASRKRKRGDAATPPPRGRVALAYVQVTSPVRPREAAHGASSPGMRHTAARGKAFGSRGASPSPLKRPRLGTRPAVARAASTPTRRPMHPAPKTSSARKGRATPASPVRRRRDDFGETDDEGTVVSDDFSNAAASDAESTDATSDDDFDVGAEEGDADDEEAGRTPSTPRKAKQVGAAAAASSNVGPTSPDGPSLASVRTPTRSRILGMQPALPALPTQAPKVTSMTLEELGSLSAHERAKRLLHVGATPERLPGREEQYEEVLACVVDAVEQQMGGCVYVSGVPGQGKTATVREVIRALRRKAERGEVRNFNFVEINGMKLPDPAEAYSLLWCALQGRAYGSSTRIAPKAALRALTSHFGRARRADDGAAGNEMRDGSAAPTVVLMDEIDMLIDGRQEIIYNLFDWPNRAGSKLVVVAVANNMALPETSLAPKVASRLGMNRIVFEPYTHVELDRIVRCRLGMSKRCGGGGDHQRDDNCGTGGIGEEGLGGCDGRSARDAQLEAAATEGCADVFEDAAIGLACRRIGNVNGDARRVLDILRRAIELVEEEAKDTAATAADGDAGGGGGCSTSPLSKVKPSHVLAVFSSFMKVGAMAHIRALPLHAKLLLHSVVATSSKRAAANGAFSGAAAVAWAEVVEHHAATCRIHAIRSHLPMSSVWASSLPPPLRHADATADAEAEVSGVNMQTRTRQGSRLSKRQLPQSGSGGLVAKVAAASTHDGCAFEWPELVPALQQLCGLGLVATTTTTSASTQRASAAWVPAVELRAQPEDVRMALVSDADARVRKVAGAKGGG